MRVHCCVSLNLQLNLQHAMTELIPPGISCMHVQPCMSNHVRHDQEHGAERAHAHAGMPGPPSYADLMHAYAGDVSAGDLSRLPPLTLPRDAPAGPGEAPMAVGDVLAYRVSELGPAFTPCVSRWRLGRVSALPGGRRLVMAPWPVESTHPLRAAWDEYSHKRQQDAQVSRPVLRLACSPTRPESGCVGSRAFLSIGLHELRGPCVSVRHACVTM